MLKIKERDTQTRGVMGPPAISLWLCFVRGESQEGEKKAKKGEVDGKVVAEATGLQTRSLAGSPGLPPPPPRPRIEG